MLPAGLRSLLALLLVATFGLRTAAPDVMRGCGPGTGAAHDTGEAAPRHQHQHAGHAADRCECVGHSCKMVIVAPPVRAALTGGLSPFRAPVPSADPAARNASMNILPPAHAPPASLAA